MTRRSWSWTDQNEKRSYSVLEVAEELRDWWPLTLRQIYYRTLAKGHFKHPEWLTTKEGVRVPLKDPYGAISTLVKWMRIDEVLPWFALEDRSRSVSDKRGYEDMAEFIEFETKYFLTGYDRCMAQGQANYVECWVEKDALAKILEDVTDRYCMRTVVCRGYQSISFIADFYKRAEMAFKKGQQPIVLYFGDLDPSGVNMFEATQLTIESELGLKGVDFRRIALTPDQVETYQLPRDPMAAKQSDTRYNKYYKRFGDLAVELDALHPKQLSQMVKNAIEDVVDMNFFKEQKEIEASERLKVREIRKDINTLIAEKIKL